MWITRSCCCLLRPYWSMCLGTVRVRLGNCARTLKKHVITEPSKTPGSPSELDQGSCSHAKNWNILLSRNPFIIKMDTQKGNDVSIRVNHARMGRKTGNKQQYKNKRESCIENWIFRTFFDWCFFSFSPLPLSSYLDFRITFGLRLLN